MNKTLAIYGLGYVGLPTALHFADKGFKVIGVDINKAIVNKLNKGEIHLKDLELHELLLKSKKNFYATIDGINAAKKANIHIICVPTPVDETKKPVLDYVFSAAKTIAKGLKKGDIVVLESTVHPTFCDEELIPFLEKESGLKINEDFGVAHVPERYNPGDQKHSIDKITRVIGASSLDVAKEIAKIYKYIVKDVHIVKDLRTAEATKIIENVQRDINIALMNEIAMICDKLNIDVKEVIEAAATKWNFIKFYPGLGVGGHCLPVDPYYLTHLAYKKEHYPKVILAGRSVNDEMPEYAFNKLMYELNIMGKPLKGSKIVVLGLSYKGNIGDYRNSPAKKLIKYLKEYEAEVEVHDPYHDEYSKRNIYEIMANADAIVIATDHDHYKKLDFSRIKAMNKDKDVLIFDARLIYDANEIKKHGLKYAGIGRGKVE